MKMKAINWEKIFATDLSDKQWLSKTYTQKIPLKLNNLIKSNQFKTRLKTLTNIIHMADKHMKICPISYVRRHIKRNVKYLNTPIGMSKIQNTCNIKCWWECAAMGALINFWWECEMVVQPLWKIVWHFLMIINMMLP